MFLRTEETVCSDGFVLNHLLINGLYNQWLPLHSLGHINVEKVKNCSGNMNLFSRPEFDGELQEKS